MTKGCESVTVWASGSGELIQNSYYISCNQTLEEVHSEDKIMEPSLYDILGGRAKVEQIAHSFYDIMEQEEPELTRLHECTEDGLIEADVRHRFALFLVGWLGGPQEYMAQYGHPRLRMRHRNVEVNIKMRDAWVRCMDASMKKNEVPEEVYNYLSARFTQVADFMRNVPEEQ